MKRLRSFFAVAIAIVVALTMVPNFSNGNKEVKAASFSITTPANNSLKPAGHIDIKWSAASGSVNHYEVYIDNAKQDNVNGTTYDYYSTAVVTHKLYVKAVKNDGSSENSDTVTFSVSKKGLGLATDMGRNIDLKELGVAWYYNWGESPSSGAQYQGVDYVPMVWKETNANNFKNRVQNAINKGYKEILTFNEPDLGGQCNMSVDAVYNVWQGIDNFNGDIRISSPVTALWPEASPNWFQAFMGRLNGNDYEPDFISIHCYPDNYAGSGMANWFVEKVVDWAWNKYHLPIWITEFSTTGSGVTATGGNGTKEFWETVMPLLDEREYVERYAGFGFNAASNPNCGLWNYNTGELTAGGEMYRDLGNPSGYDPSNLPGAAYKTEIGHKNTLLEDNVTINNVGCTDYISQGGINISASAEYGGNKIGNAIDNDVTSRWESPHGQDSQQVTIDLGSTKNIKEIDILWEGASASKYALQVSNDGNNWEEVAVIESGEGARWDKTTLKKQASARYIRIDCIARVGNYGYSIFDIAVYGSDNTAIDATTAKPTTTARPTTTKTPAQTKTTQITAFGGAKFTSYIGSDWSTSKGNITASANGDFTASITNGGDNSNYDAIQGQYLEIKVDAGSTYTYTTTLSSTVKKKVTIKIADTNDNMVSGGYKAVTLTANTPQTLTFTITPKSSKIKIIYFIANHSGEKLNGYTVKVTGNSLLKAGAQNNTATNVVAESTAGRVNAKPAKVVINKIAKKKKSAKKLSVTIKKVANATGYLVAVYKSKAKANSNKSALYKKTISKNTAKLVVKSKKLKNKKKLFVRVRAFNDSTGVKIFGDWSEVKKVKVK